MPGCTVRWPRCSGPGSTVEVLGLGQAALGPAGATVMHLAARQHVHRAAAGASGCPGRPAAGVLITLDPDVVPAALLVGAAASASGGGRRARGLRRPARRPAWARRGRRRLQALAGRCIALAGRAALTVVADDHVPPQAAACHRRLVVRNLPDAASLPIPIPAPDRPPLRAVYVGDVRTSRGLRDMVEAVAAAPPWQLDIVGPVAAADLDWLEQRLTSPRLRIGPGDAPGPEGRCGSGCTADSRRPGPGRSPPGPRWGC